MEKKISVVVPIYNVEQYLRRCLDSIVQQTYQNLEIILVNDGSLDDSDKIMQTYAEKDTRIKCIDKINGGLSDARNVGMQHASGEYIIFIDSDDYIDFVMIESLYNQIEKEQADVSICNIMNEYTTKQTPQCANTDLYFVCGQEQFLAEYLLGEKIPGSICNKLIKMEIAKQLLFPKGKIYEDAFYQYDLMQIAQKYVVNTKPYYHYFHRANSITTTPFKERDLVYIEIYQKFYDFIMVNYLSLKEIAFFRLAYAHFYIFDKMLQVDDYQKLSQYKRIKHFLKKHAFSIATNRYFRKGRRIAALVLKFQVGAYRYLLEKDIEKNKKIH